MCSCIKKKSICIKLKLLWQSIHLSLRVNKSMLIDIGCQKKYIDVFFMKFLCFLLKSSIRNYNTLCDIYFEMYTPPWNQPYDMIIETPNHTSTRQNELYPIFVLQYTLCYFICTNHILFFDYLWMIFWVYFSKLKSHVS